MSGRIGMGERIAHPGRDTRGAFNRFLAALQAALAAAASRARDAAAAPVLDDFARRVSAVATATIGEPAPTAQRERVPACRFWDAALRDVSLRDVATELGVLGPTLSWTQNPNYRRRPPDPTFLDNYGYAVIAGPPDGPPPLAVTPSLALGVVLLGPHAHYPRHAHPAVEIYYTLTAAEWWRDPGPWRAEPAGTAIYHAPNVRHATRAGPVPLLAIYLWRGDLSTHAALV